MSRIMSDHFGFRASSKSKVRRLIPVSREVRCGLISHRLRGVFAAPGLRGRRMCVGTCCGLMLLAMIWILFGNPIQAVLAIESYDVLVKKEPAAVQRRTFTKRSEPKLSKDEKGRTDTKFQLGVNLEFDLVDTRKIGERIMVTIQPKQTTAKLSLPITIWIPEGAPESLIDHEDGHRKIAERIYEEADGLIRYHSREILGKYFQGEGADEAAAIKSAYQLAATRLNELYRKAIYDYSRCVNEEYDRLTRHGLDEIDEDEAVEQSFRHCQNFLEILGDAKRDAERSQYLWERPR